MVNINSINSGYDNSATQFLEMRRTKAIFAIPFLCLLLQSCFMGTKISENAYHSSIILNTDILPGSDICVLKQFQGICLDNKFYINWLTLSNTNDFIFILEYSINGKDFKPYCLRKGSASPNITCPLLYCVTDSLITNKVVFFRLNAVPENKTINYADEKKYNALRSATTIKINRNISNARFNLFQKL